MNEVKEIRKRYGMTQQQLAALLTVPQSTISRWETGKVKIDNVKFKGIIYVLENYKNNSLEGK